ncbi:hypothetical protein SAMN06265349_103601 [Flavobacterium resistens]|uniref:Lipoprotein n=1 Tax=Flavobacterium resistens TaxID=443612 RepID=A0A521DUG8_9FLAO|nr:hypothetical protein [Flavobacterium resistens]MRX68151.1 hypothetical protein [Flavobacterium resistens]SMO75288.1 hypothetical protein SAMN06265349_103601 [Flavobacterium resistens]
MRLIKLFLLLSLLFTACKEKTATEIRYTNLPPKPPKTEIKWLTENPVKIKTKINLSYLKGFECDSVIGIDYIGFSGEDFYFPINEKGQYISTICKKQKLNKEQISRLSSILSNKKMFENPNIVGCYEPRLGFIYFKNNEVICQTIVCIGCSKLESSAEIASLNFGFNEKARIEFKKLNSELGFSKD